MRCIVPGPGRWVRWPDGGEGATAATARGEPHGDSSYTQTVGPRGRQSRARRAGPVPRWLHGLAFHPRGGFTGRRRAACWPGNTPFADVSVTFRPAHPPFL